MVQGTVQAREEHGDRSAIGLLVERKRRLVEARVGPAVIGGNQNDARRLIAQAYASGLPDPFGAGSSYSNTRGLKMTVWTNP